MRPRSKGGLGDRLARGPFKLGPYIGLLFLAAFLVGGWAAGVLLLPGLTIHSSQASTTEPQIIMSLSFLFPRALWGPRGCSDALPLQCCSGGLGLLFLGCCHCFAKPAVMHYIGANPSASLLLALACARLCWAASHCKPLVEQAFSVVRKLQFHLQASGLGRKKSFTSPTLQQDSASLHPHIVLGSRARPWVQVAMGLARVLVLVSIGHDTS